MASAPEARSQRCASVVVDLRRRRTASSLSRARVCVRTWALLCGWKSGVIRLDAGRRAASDAGVRACAADGCGRRRGGVAIGLRLCLPERDRSSESPSSADAAQRQREPGRKAVGLHARRKPDDVRAHRAPARSALAARGLARPASLPSTDGHARGGLRRSWACGSEMMQPLEAYRRSAIRPRGACIARVALDQDHIRRLGVRLGAMQF